MAQLINERDMGIEDMTEDMERSYLQSCEHNEVDPDDLTYFRSYVWANIALLVERIRKAEDSD